MNTSQCPVDISVVIPVYGAPELVAPLVDRLQASLDALGVRYEVLLVNDACPRGSWEQIAELAASRPWLRGINLSRNFGQHFAIAAGLDHTQGEWVVVMDCDLQDRPEEIEKLYRKGLEGYDVVFGRRADRQDTLMKVAPGMAFHLLFSWLSGEKTDRSIGNFSISRRRVVEACRQYRERDRSFGQVVKMVGFRQTAIDIVHAKRPSGESSYTLGSLLRFSSRVLVSGSNRPLQLSAYGGSGISGVSFFYGVSLVFRYTLFGVSVEGWTSLAVLIAFFSGAILLQLGVIGLYLGRAFNESKNRPLYHVRDQLNEPVPSALDEATV